MAECSEISQKYHKTLLFTLPPELIGRILDILSCRDANSLVQTCRWGCHFNEMLYNKKGALFYAAKRGGLDCAKKALEFTDNVNRREPETKITALATALECDQDDIAKLILGHTDIDVSFKVNGVLLFQYAAKKKEEVWSMLLKRTKDSNLNDRSTFGATPLTAAIDAGNTELACLLLGRQADAFTRGGYKNMSPLELAAQRGNKDIVERLLESNANGQIANSPGVLAIAAEGGGSLDIA